MLLTRYFRWRLKYNLPIKAERATGRTMRKPTNTNKKSTIRIKETTKISISLSKFMFFFSNYLK